MLCGSAPVCVCVRGGGTITHYVPDYEPIQAAHASRINEAQKLLHIRESVYAFVVIVVPYHILHMLEMLEMLDVLMLCTQPYDKSCRTFTNDSNCRNIMTSVCACSYMERQRNHFRRTIKIDDCAYA